MSFKIIDLLAMVAFSKFLTGQCGSQQLLDTNGYTYNRERIGLHQQSTQWMTTSAFLCFHTSGARRRRFDSQVSTLPKLISGNLLDAIQ